MFGLGKFAQKEQLLAFLLHLCSACLFRKVGILIFYVRDNKIQM